MIIKHYLIKATSSSRIKPSYSSTNNLIKWPNKPTCTLLDQWLLSVSDRQTDLQRRFEREIQLRDDAIDNLRTKLSELERRFSTTQSSNEETSKQVITPTPSYKEETLKSINRKGRSLIVGGMPITDSKSEQEQVFRLLKQLKVDPTKYRSLNAVFIFQKHLRDLLPA